MKIIRLIGTIIILHFTLFPCFGDIGINVEGRYDKTAIKQDVPMNTKKFEMTSLNELLLLQFMPGTMTIRPYIGLGLGLIPSKEGTKTQYLTVPISLETQITLKNILYGVVEIGPEFVFSSIRWQIFLGYNHEFKGTLSRTDNPIYYTGLYKDTKLTEFRRIQIGTRLYFLVTSGFDIGLVGAYAIGAFRDDGKNGVQGVITDYRFTEISVGLALRARFGSGRS